MKRTRPPRDQRRAFEVIAAAAGGAPRLQVPFSIHPGNVAARSALSTVDPSSAREASNAKARHWLDYDSVAFAVLVVGMGAIELLALSI